MLKTGNFKCNKKKFLSFEDGIGRQLLFKDISRKYQSLVSEFITFEQKGF